MKIIRGCKGGLILKKLQFYGIKIVDLYILKILGITLKYFDLLMAKNGISAAI
jgi:hypothetical protein